MKCLHLNIYFKLPEDFNGDLNDALIELINYRKSDKPESEYIEDKELNFYENWWKMVNTTESKLYGEYSVSELFNGFWIDLKEEKNFNLDEVLDKLNSIGFENLSEEEKDFLKSQKNI